ncbi:MAG TPA: hypothetical protein VN951_00125 [Pyrinomonadaceae bacterium]|nr:hypothetical protein [Pyrinomonadaceae bacterium]
MNFITQFTSRRSILSSRIVTLALVAFGLIALQSSPAQGQWASNGNNINNTNTGNVGIGTTSQAAKLDVNAGGTTHLLLGADSNVPTYNVVSLNGSATDAGHLGLAGGGGTDKTLYVDTPTAGTINFRVNVSSKVLIDSNGNVGIGTTGPSQKFQVIGTAGFFNSASGISINGGLSAGIADLYSDYLSGSEPKLHLATFSKKSTANGITIDTTGNVGIGTSDPSVGGTENYNRLTVLGSDSTAVAGGLINTGSGQIGFTIKRTGTTPSRWYQYIPSGSTDLRFYNGSDLITLQSGGNVGIGTNSPTKKLDVVGDVNASGTITGGIIVAKYQDVAEWVESSQALPAGTVVVLDQTKSNQVIASSHAYDTRVAGVVSAQPGITLGEQGDSKVLVATTGRVKVRVDATNEPIQVGDLLVTSDIEGVAKKSEPLMLGGAPIHRPGTLIGKALEPLAKGSGWILVLLSLQ